MRASGNRQVRLSEARSEGPRPKAAALHAVPRSVARLRRPEAVGGPNKNLSAKPSISSSFPLDVGRKVIERYDWRPQCAGAFGPKLDQLAEVGFPYRKEPSGLGPLMVPFLQWAFGERNVAIPLSLIGGGLSALGGIFGGFSAKSEARKARERQLGMYFDAVANAQAAERTPLVKDVTGSSSSSGSVDFAGLVRDAEAAGFNPGSALKAGAAGYYARTVSQTNQHEVTTGHNAGLAAQLIAQMMGVPVPTASSDPWSGGLSALGSAIASYGAAQEDRMFQMAKQQSYLNGVLNSGRGAAGQMFSVPSVISSGSSSKKVGNYPSSTTKTLASVGKDPAKGGTVLNIPFLGPIQVTNRSLAEDVENVFGDNEILNTIYSTLLGAETYIQQTKDPGSRVIVDILKSTPADLFQRGLNAVTTWARNNELSGPLTSSQRASGGRGSVIMMRPRNADGTW